jgi:hypothetical protein
MTHDVGKRSRWSLWSEDSFLSIGSKGSFCSIGSVGSAFSVGSVGSWCSAFSVGSAWSFCSALSAMSAFSVLSWRSKGGVLTAPGQDGRGDEDCTASAPDPQGHDTTDG